MKKYLLDPYVISILYQTKTDEETLAIYNEVMSKLFLLILETVKYHLQEKGLSNDEIENIVNALNNPEQSELNESQQAILKEEALLKLLTDSIDQFGQIIYDKLLPILPVAERKELHKYLEAADPIVKYNALSALADLVDVDNEQLQQIDLKTLAGDPGEVLNENIEKAAENVVTVPENLAQPSNIEISNLENVPVALENEAPIIKDESQDSSNGVEAVDSSVMPGTVVPQEQIVSPLGDNQVNLGQSQEILVQKDENQEISNLAETIAEPQVTESNVSPVDQLPQAPEKFDTASQIAVNQTEQQPVEKDNELSVGEINVAPIEQETSSDPLSTPIKATIVDDEQPEVGGDVNSENNVNAVNQLQNMGIDLNDVLQQRPPQS